MTINRSGPMSAQDKEYIRSNYTLMTAKEIANQLQRNPKAILKFLKAEGLIDSAKRISSISTIEYDLRKTPHWDQLKKQFAPEELESFMYHWNNTIKQFRDDVTHLEELQIIGMIKIEVLMNRLLIQERQTQLRIAEVEKQIHEERLKAIEYKDPETLEMLEATMSHLYGAKDSIGKEYREMASRLEKMMVNLKGTRDQRLQEVESSKDTMVGWIKMLMQQPELRKKIGMAMEKMRIAMKVEYERLSDYHQYIDGSVDQPILTAETVKEDHYE